MKERDLLILAAIILVAWILLKRAKANAAPPANAATPPRETVDVLTPSVTTSETYRLPLPDGTFVDVTPESLPYTNDIGYWYSILQLGPLGAQ
jgi:hypothetical protein